jgi:hypothetical protein
MIIQQHGDSVEFLESGQIRRLVLAGRQIVAAVPEGSKFDAGGSFTMFPWVGRLQDGQLKYFDPSEKGFLFDSNKMPIHGLVATSPK